MSGVVEDAVKNRTAWPRFGRLWSTASSGGTGGFYHERTRRRPAKFREVDRLAEVGTESANASRRSAPDRACVSGMHWNRGASKAKSAPCMSPSEPQPRLHSCEYALLVHSTGR